MRIEKEYSEIQKVQQIPKSDVDECELWRSFKSGDKAAFGQIFKLYHKPLSLYGQKIYPDYDFINDCIQEMFLEFWQYRETIGVVNSVKFYIIKCFKRRVLRNLELLKKRETKTLSNNYDRITSNSFELDLIANQGEQHKRYVLSKEIEGLTKRQQEAIFLKFYQDLSYEEICAIMSLNYQSVKNLVHNSIKIMREKLVVKNIFSVLLAFLLFQ